MEEKKEKSAYEKLLEAQQKYAENNSGVIKAVNSCKDSPQEILWQKTVSDKLEDEDAKCERINDKYYFTEGLVNKLMHFAYLKGRNSIDEKSHSAGWDDCTNHIIKTLEH